MNIKICRQLRRALERFQRWINSKSSQIWRCRCPTMVIRKKLLTKTSIFRQRKFRTQKPLNTHRTQCQTPPQTNLFRFRYIRQRIWAGIAKALDSKLKITTWNIIIIIALIFNIHSNSKIRMVVATCTHRCLHSITWWTVTQNNSLPQKVLRQVFVSHIWVVYSFNKMNIIKHNNRGLYSYRPVNPILLTPIKSNKINSITQSIMIPIWLAMQVQWMLRPTKVS